MLREHVAPTRGKRRLLCVSACSAGRQGACASALRVGPESAAMETPHLASDRRVHRQSAGLRAVMNGTSWMPPWPGREIAPDQRLPAPGTSDAARRPQASGRLRQRLPTCQGSQSPGPSCWRCPVHSAGTAVTAVELFSDPIVLRCDRAHARLEPV